MLLLHFCIVFFFGGGPGAPGWAHWGRGSAGAGVGIGVRAVTLLRMFRSHTSVTDKWGSGGK